MENKQTIAENLLKINAIQIRPNDLFTWTSGIKSPIYCDNRLTMSYPSIRNQIADGFVEKIKDNYPEVEVIAGCATAGIPHAAWVADKLNLPMCYVRGKAKGHGKQNQIEGAVEAGQKVIVVEDLISTGKSSIEAAVALQRAGAEVLGVLSIFTYGLTDAQKAFEEKGLTYESLTNFDVMVADMAQQEKITREEKAFLLNWRDELSL